MKIKIDLINPGVRIRSVNPEQVAALRESIREVGLINAITVRPTPVIRGGRACDGYMLVAGLHRLEATKGTGATEIEAHVVEMAELQAQLAECDENLCSTKLTAAERAMFTKRRKDVYEQLHPETRHGGDRKSSRQLGDLNEGDRFTANTAANTGQSERAVQRDATRGERIADDVLASVKGTELDKGAILDEIAKAPRDQQADKARELERRIKDRKLIHAAGDTIVKRDACDDLAIFLLDRIAADDHREMLDLMDAANAGAVAKAIRRELKTGQRRGDRPLFDMTRSGRA